MGTEQRLQLFQTIESMRNHSNVKLSNSDLEMLRKQTEDLVRKSIMNKKYATKTPEGFEEIVDKIKGIEDADEVFEIVIDFLKSKGVEIEDESDEEKEEDIESKKLNKGKGKGKGKEDSMDFGKDEDSSKSEIKDNLDKFKDKKEDKKEDKKDVDVTREDLDKAKSVVLALAKKYSQENTSDENASRFHDLQKREKDQGLNDKTEEEMGIESELMTARKANYTVKVSNEKNIVVYGNKGPLFYAVPEDYIKSDKTALNRLANKVRGLIAYEGIESTARKCGARIISGVDDNIETVTDQEIPPVTEGVTNGAETVTKEKPEEMKNTSQDEAEFVTEEKQDKVDADTGKVSFIDSSAKARIKARIEARRRARKADVLDNADNVTEDEKPEKPNMSVTDNAEDVSEEKPKKLVDSTLSDNEVDFRTASKELENRYRRLYSTRAKKWAEDKLKETMNKFDKCVRIISKRMLLNYEEDPYKAAAYNVLVSDDVRFSNGDKFNSMDRKDAMEIIELISQEGHNELVSKLLDRAASLMHKDDNWLNDTEEDLKHLSPVQAMIDNEEEVPAIMKKSKMFRDAANDGNFELKEITRTTATGSQQSSVIDGIRSAIGGSTKIGRRLNGRGI